MNIKDINDTLDMLEAVKAEIALMPDSIERTKAMQAMVSLLLHLEYRVKEEIRKVG